jgi:hypothetical protein
MFNNADDIFTAFLDGIRKTHTATVRPEKFIRIWNDWAMPTWIASNTSLQEGVELSQKQIDDLANIRAVYYLSPADWDAKGFTFKKPDEDSALYSPVFNEVMNADEQEPRTYLRSLSAQFKLNYATGQECGLTGTSGWLDSTYLKSNMENVVKKSTYRKPKDSRLYHAIYGNYIKLMTDPNSASTGNLMRIDFLYYPNVMEYRSDYGLLYTIDLPFYQLVEIVAVAVKLYLERVQSPRWQSFFQEEMAKRVDKI